MRKHSGLPKLASPARIKKQQHKLNTLKIKSIKTSLPSFLSPTLPSANRSASDHTSWKLCSNFHSCKYCSIFNWCFSQKPSKAVSISCSWPSNLEHRRRTGLEQFANRGQALEITYSGLLDPSSQEKSTDMYIRSVKISERIFTKSPLQMTTPMWSSCCYLHLSE